MIKRDSSEEAGHAYFREGYQRAGDIACESLMDLGVDVRVAVAAINRVKDRINNTKDFHAQYTQEHQEGFTYDFDRLANFYFEEAKLDLRLFKVVGGEE